MERMVHVTVGERDGTMVAGFGRLDRDPKMWWIEDHPGSGYRADPDACCRAEVRGDELYRVATAWGPEGKIDELVRLVRLRLASVIAREASLRIESVQKVVHDVEGLKLDHLDYWCAEAKQLKEAADWVENDLSPIRVAVLDGSLG